MLQPTEEDRRAQDAPLSSILIRLRGASPTSAELPLFVAWAAMTVGSLSNFSFYSSSGILFVASASGLIVLSLVGRVAPADGWSRRAGYAIAFASVVFGFMNFPSGRTGSGLALATARLLASSASAVVALGLLTPSLSRRKLAYAAIGVMALGGLAIIGSDPHPGNNTWAMLQSASSAIAGGHNPYLIHWRLPGNGGLGSGFLYLPGAALLLAPFHAIFGDIRYGLVAFLGLTGCLLVRRCDGTRALVAAMVFVYPGTLYGIEQGWVEPLVLFALCGMAYGVARGNPRLAMLSLAAGLAIEPITLLVLPLAAVWPRFGWRRALGSAALAGALTAPWAATTLSAFFSGVRQSVLGPSWRLNAMSLSTTATLHGLRPTVAWAIPGVMVAMAVAIWRGFRNEYGFLLGCAAIFALFDLANRGTNYASWELVSGLVLSALVLGVGHRTAPPMHIVSLPRAVPSAVAVKSS